MSSYHTQKKLKDKTRKFSLSQDELLYTHQETDFENPEWEKAQYHVLIARLSPFADVSESRPHLFLFNELRNHISDCYVDFAFFPKSADIPVLERENLPFWYGIASGRAANEFDMILVSNSCTIELVNMVPTLEKSGIPAHRSKRIGKAYPYILLGGSNALAAGALLEFKNGSYADAVPDGFFFGEGEHCAGALTKDILAVQTVFLKNLVTHTAQDTLPQADQKLFQDRENHLFELAKRYEGFYPAGYTGTVKQKINHAEPETLKHYPILASHNTDTVRLEISSGCPSFCSFCFEGYERKPYREISFEKLIDNAKKLKMLSGANTVELSSYNFNTHTNIVAVIETLNNIYKRVNFMSQRVDILAQYPELIDYEFSADKRSYTLGIEGISQKQRMYYNKELDFSKIKKVITRLLKHKAKEIKLFYILSGFETQEDFDAFKCELAEIKTLLERGTYKPFMLVSTGYLVRMPGTPLAFERLIVDEAAYTKLSKQMEAIVSNAGMEFRTPHYFDEYAVTQILALAPHNVLDLLFAFYHKRIYYDGTLSKKAFTVLQSWLTAHEYLHDSLIGEKTLDWSFPFSFVERPITKQFLYKKFLNAKACKEEATCFAVVSKTDNSNEAYSKEIIELPSCKACGACIDENERQALLNHVVHAPLVKNIETTQRLIKQKQKPWSIKFTCTIPAEFAFAPAPYLEALVIKDILLKFPHLSETLLSAEDILLKKLEFNKKILHPSGKSIVSLNFKEAPDTAVIQAIPKIITCLHVKDLVDEISLIQTYNISIKLAALNISEAETLFSKFLQKEAIPFTLQRKNSVTLFVIPEKGRKKHNILEASLYLDNSRCFIETLCGSKLDFSELIMTIKKYDIPSRFDVEW